jgi:hypothetical protein
MKIAHAFALLWAIALAGCTTAPMTAPNDNYCRLGGVITYSRHDTPGTVRQVRRSNARYDRVCG